MQHPSLLNFILRKWGYIKILKGIESTYQGFN